MLVLTPILVLSLTYCSLVPVTVLTSAVGMRRIENHRRGRVYTWFGLDMRPHPQISVRGNALILPFKDCAFKAAISWQSLEHFPNPWKRCKKPIAFWTMADNCLEALLFWNPSMIQLLRLHRVRSAVKFLVTAVLKRWRYLPVLVVSLLLVGLS